MVQPECKRLGMGEDLLEGGTVDGEVLKGDEPQRLQAGIDQPIN